MSEVTVVIVFFILTGMHELLAPLQYVLHVDVERLSEVRKAYEDHFVDKFDGFSFHENDLTYKFDFKKFSEEDESKCEKSPKIASLAELDPVVQTIILLSDAYGAEGELGIVLSEKFMEHDAYSMFDALMSGGDGAVAMAEFFSPSPYRSTHSMFTPVIEASAAMYHLLSLVDSSVHTHLVELGVEPQYFSLRWLRVLFGREFSLEELLLIWDEIFACDNTRFVKEDDTDGESTFGVLDSPRGAFISAFAVSMILMIRSSLLATENATACLQRLLNFPDDASLVKLVEKAKSLQTLAVDVNHSSPLLVPGLYDLGTPGASRGYNHSLDPSSPRTPLRDTPKSYWEEKWRVLHNKEEEYKQAGVVEKVPHIKKGWSDKVKPNLTKTEADPSSPTKNERTPKKNERTNLPDPTVRRSLLNDLARQLGDDDKENPLFNEIVEHQYAADVSRQDDTKTSVDILSRAGSEENCLNLSNPQSPNSRSIDHENMSERSSVASNSSIDVTYAESCRTNSKPSPHLVSCISPDVSSRCTPQNEDSIPKSPKLIQYTRTLSGKFNWLLKLGRNANEGTPERPTSSEGTKESNGEIGQNSVAGCSTVNACAGSSATSKGETVDQNLMISLRNLAQSMLENIEVRH